MPLICRYNKSFSAAKICAQGFEIFEIIKDMIEVSNVQELLFIIYNLLSVFRF